MHYPILTFRRLAFTQLVYLLFVIVLGAYVRATSSGAGCGRHWPLCKGQLLPSVDNTKTIIEFSHRITSGLSLVLCGIVVWFALRHLRHNRAITRASLLTALFLLLEGLLGAALVLLEHVADNPSAYRAYSMGLHLINTYCLMASATFTWWYATDFGALHRQVLQPSMRLWRLLGMFILVTISVTGALTALGDTLFPVAEETRAFDDLFEDSKHFLIRVRVFHPMIAIIGSLTLLGIVNFLSDLRQPVINRLSALFNTLLIMQLLLGALNIYLDAPITVQLIHLLLAELVWMVYVLWAAK